MNFSETLKTTIKQDPRFVSEDGTLLRTQIREAATNLDSALLGALLVDPTLRQHFFTEVDDMMVFDKQKFMWVIDSKEFLPDSYTAYRNRIGLSANDYDLLTTSGEVSLVWPYKDCILEGGQDKDDQKRDEIFYNETLAPDEVGQLLAPKAFSSAKRYSANGAEEVAGGGIDNDNLVIKGNNLLALSSLLHRYRGKVKCIYIDPPYNTGSDSFRYNDRFSRATWLTFMKNRVQLAKQLLSPDGVFVIQSSFHQAAYLEVMLDEIEALHKVMVFHCLVRHPDRSLAADKDFNDVVEVMMVYSSNPQFKMPKKEVAKSESEYVYTVQLGNSIETTLMGGKEVQVYLPDQWKVEKGESDRGKFKSISIRGSIREKNSSGRFYVANIEPLASKYPPMTLFCVPKMGDDGHDYRYFSTPKNGNKNGVYYQGMPLSSSVTRIPYPNFIDLVNQYNSVSAEGGVEFRNAKKPELLIKFMLDMFTHENDLVLDYFAGSGTTAATAHKMGRRYITVEQMDYIEDVTIERLKNVINGEQSGISASVDWQGGGSFVYCELAQKGENWLDSLQEAETSEDVQCILDAVTDKGLLRPSVLPDSLKDNTEDFKALSLEEQKRVVAELIDKNRLYVNASDVDDESSGLTDADRAFTKSFYRNEEA